MNSKAAVVVPICVDALVEPARRIVLSALADFSLLPWVDKTPKAKGLRDQARTDIPIDVGSDTAYISENIVAQPFGDQNLELGGGVHLHWALPDALTRGKHPGTDRGQVDAIRPLDFPNAPNRWRVQRSGGRAPMKSRTWVVESDHLWPVAGPVPNTIAYPLSKPRDGEPPYRRLGRVLEVLDDKPYREDATADTLARRNEPLTAMGWGDPSFHAFYPNCHSVFGFHDAELCADADVVYSITGWYSAPDLDPVRQAIADDRYTKEAFERAFGWKVEEASWDRLRGDPAAGMICYGRITVKAGGSKVPADADHDASATQVVFANSGTEAVATHMAKQPAEGKPPITETDRRVLEQQAAATRHQRELQDCHVDHHAKLDEARHTASFTAVPGGTLWTFRDLPVQSAAQADAARGKKPVPLAADAAVLVDQLDGAIHSMLAEKLHLLNQYQLAFDRGLAVIRAGRRQCYADWYKYMVCSYRPPEATRDHDYPAIDDVRRLIEVDVAWLNLVCRFVGQPIVPDHRLDDTAAAQLALRLRARLRAADSAGKPADKQPGGVGEALAVQELADWYHGFLNSPGDPMPQGGGEVIAAIAGEVLPQGSALAPQYMPSALEATAAVAFLSLAERRDGIKAILSGLIGIIDDLHAGRALGKDRPLPEAIQDKLQDKLGLLAGHLASAAKRGDTDSLLTELRRRFPAVELREVPAPRFWRPNEPTILLAGEHVKPGDRHSQGGRLWVLVHDVQVDPGHVVVTPPELAASFSSRLPSNLDAKEKIATDQQLDKVKDEAEIGLLVCEFASRLAVLDRPRQVAYYHQHRNEVDAWARSEFDAWKQSKSLMARTTDGAPWHPLFVEWEVAVLPLEAGGNLPADRRRYQPDFIEQNHTLKERSSDLSAVDKNGACRHEFLAGKPAAGRVTPSRTVFSGRSILTPHAVKAVRQHVDKTVARHAESPPAAAAASGARAMLDHAHAARQLLDGAPDSNKPPLIAQSQSLSGFNDGLLMHRQTLQLPIADPLAFEDYRLFTETTVRQVVAGQNLVAPEPWFDFHPIRTGQMRIRRLRLVDTFGQVRPVPLGQAAPIASSHALAVDVQLDEAHRTVNLPPRLTQPARVNFRWLSAADDAQETNSHALSSPVCGWVVPNNADRSLTIYDGTGTALGYIEETGRWRSAPGRSGPAFPADIGNPHLARMVGWICERARLVAKDDPGTPTRFMDDYLDVLDSALENIEPENFAQHVALALLIGRPMALVRAFVNVELQGPPACRQSWEDLHRRLRGEPAGTDGFCDVRFPFRIGEHLQLNDGVVGYWLEEGDRYRNDCFHAPQSDYNAQLRPSEKIFIYRDGQGGALNFQHALNDAPQKVALLMDPRGLAHCTCGVLPTKALALPVEHTAGALKRMKVSFLSAPVLTDPGRVNMPLPSEPGFTWSWLQMDQLRWTELSTTPRVERAAFLKAFPQDGDAVWRELLARRWIEPLPGRIDAATVVPRPNRLVQKLDDLQKRDEDIERVLDVSERVLAQVSQEARFGPVQEIREGWLELTPSDDKPRSR